MSFILLFMRVFVGAIFIFSGWQKLIAPPENFAAVIESYQILKPSLAMLAAYFFPWLELIFGTFLTLGFLSRTSAFFLSICSTLFIVLLARSLVLHLPITECGCFGSGFVLTPRQALILDSGLLFVSLMLMWRRPTLASLDERLHK